jgi:hypothetical protein
MVMISLVSELSVALPLDLPTLEERLFPGGSKSQPEIIDMAKQFK